jgi:protein MPE1
LEKSNSRVCYLYATAHDSAAAPSCCLDFQLVARSEQQLVKEKKRGAMSSTILYKFRSGTTFEALPLPGTAARLFDVKRAIVLAKKLDGGALEFDLSVRDATTNQEYVDESMLLPRGTRVIVQRLPAAKGHGFLARMARASAGLPPGGGMVPGASMEGPTSATHHNSSSSFYTIDSRARDDDEFVPAGGAVGGGEAAAAASTSEEQELAALRAATDAAATSRTGTGGPALSGASSLFPRGPGGRPLAGSAGVVPGTLPPGSRQHQQHGGYHPGGAAGGGGYRQRPNADPELREQEKQLLPKKRATGIPRTFLSLTAPGTDEGGDGGSAPLLQPNAIGFEELVNRRGGQSESAVGTSRDLDYALKVTATSIPEYLQCAICHNVVKDAMILPWDPEGRTTCESCIRDALAQSGFRCPLTGIEGVSPDDLLPNAGLRRAADMFVKTVFDKLQEIEQQVDDDDDDQGALEDHAGGEKEALEGENAEKGVLVSRRVSMTTRQKNNGDDPFGVGDTDFGGDVFAVSSRKEEKNDPKSEEVEGVNLGSGLVVSPPVEKEQRSPIAAGGKDARPNDGASFEKEASVEEGHKAPQASAGNPDRSPLPSTPFNRDNRARSTSPTPARSGGQPSKVGSGGRREAPKRRGPPLGYAMGPAGFGAIVGPPEPHDSNGRGSRSPRDMGREGRSEGHDDPNARGGGGGAIPYDRTYQGRGDRGGRHGAGRFEGRYDIRGGEFRDNVRVAIRTWAVCIAKGKVGFVTKATERV